MMHFQAFERNKVTDGPQTDPLVEIRGRTKKCSIVSKECSINARNVYHLGNRHGAV